MTPIPVTQYLFPNGRKVYKTMHVHDDAAALFNKHNLVASMECEPGGDVVVYITSPDWEEEDELLDICVNGESHGGMLSPGEGLSKLIREAAEMITGEEEPYDE